VRQEVERADPWLIAVATGIVCFTYLLRAYRWQVLLAPLAPASLHKLFAATTVGFGALFVIGRAGEVLRPAFLAVRERRVDPGAAFVTIGVERIFDMAAVVTLFAVNLLWFRAPGGDSAKYAPVRIAGFALLVGLVAGVAGLCLFKRYSRRLVSWLDEKFTGAPSLRNRVGRVFVNLLRQLAAALNVLVNARELAVVVSWTALLWAAVTVANWLVLRAFGLHFGLGETLFVLGWSLVGSLVPTPGGGAGAFHTTTKTGLVFIGVASEQAAAISIVMHLVLFAPAFFFGFYYFARSDVQLSSLRHFASTSAEGSAVEVAPDDKISASGDTTREANAHL